MQNTFVDLRREEIAPSNYLHISLKLRQPFGKEVETISFEWPRYCLGWTKQPVLDFLASFNMSSVLIDGCAFGMDHKGDPIKKQWRIVTDHKRLLDDLAPWTCSKDHKRKEISGSLTSKTAYYNSLAGCYSVLDYWGSFSILAFNLIPKSFVFLFAGPCSSTLANVVAARSLLQSVVMLGKKSCPMRST